MGTERPTVGQWRAWYARFKQLLHQHAAREDKAGTFARRLEREGESLWVFLDVQGVEATNNIAERAHRFGVLWRKRSQGTCSEKGNRWVERVLSLRHTCRIRGRSTFPVLVEAVSCLFKGERPDLSWITQHVSLPVPSQWVGTGRGLYKPVSLYPPLEPDVRLLSHPAHDGEEPYVFSRSFILPGDAPGTACAFG
jgi:transposase